MYNLFTSALLLAGAVMAAPSSMDLRAPQKCTQKSMKTKQWTVKDFDLHASYTFSTPAHQISSGSVSFNLENPNVPYKARCEGYSTQLSDFFYGNFVYTCTQPVSGDAATFTFNRPTNELKVNQTWACPGEGSRFWAQGGAKFNLICADKTWTNDNWTMGHGDPYSVRTVTCNHIDAPVPIESMQAVA